jgi:hypothetical protein
LGVMHRADGVRTRHRRRQLPGHDATDAVPVALRRCGEVITRRARIR